MDGSNERIFHGEQAPVTSRCRRKSTVVRVLPYSKGSLGTVVPRNVTYDRIISGSISTKYEVLPLPFFVFSQGKHVQSLHDSRVDAVD